MITTQNLCGVVVWYNPVEEYCANIATYSHCCKKLFVVDNSTSDNSALLANKGFANVEYLPQYANKGIAAALNIGCQCAIAQGAEWILTMDQDSHFYEGGMENFLHEVNQYSEQEGVGEFGVRHVNDEWEHKEVPAAQFQELDDIWTSGALLNTAAYKKAGAFREEFFMDATDVEYSFRLRQYGYKIVAAWHTELHHVLGRGIIRSNFFGSIKYLINDAPLRKYYICRNMLYCGKLHPNKKSWARKYVLKQLKKTLLYDHTPDKWQKIGMMLKGVRDYRRGVVGQLVR